MNQDIANYIKSLLINPASSTNVWISKIAGLVWPLQKTNESTKATIFPVSCDHNSQTCDEGQYIELVPNEKERAIIYFEELQGAQLSERMPHRIYKYETVIRLVCWFNKAKFLTPTCNLRSLLVHDIISNIDHGYSNSSPYRRIHVASVTEVEHSRDVFAGYTYDEDLTQYMFDPYDFFALDINLTFELSAECVSEIEINDQQVC